MERLIAVLQVAIALGIYNVWLVRSSRATNWRGGSATNIQEEFALYGLPGWSVWLVGGMKLLFATALILGLWIPAVTAPAALAIAVLMLGAVTMHLKVGDPVKKSAPAATMLLLALVVAFG